MTLLTKLKFWNQSFRAIRPWLRGLGGAAIGVALAITLYCLKFPPSGPDYHEGDGWGLILIVVIVPAGATLGGLWSTETFAILGGLAMLFWICFGRT